MKKNHMFALLSMTLLFSSPSLHAGGEMGNGGDVVNCRSMPSVSPYVGSYSLDYVLEDNSGAAGQLVRIGSWAESRSRILSQLRLKFPELAYGFEGFSRYVGMPADYSAPRVWEKAPFGLVDIKDEQLLKSLPPNCLEPAGADGMPRLIQAVIRKAMPETVVYYYDSQILQTLLTERPQQYSFLMVHEWLWDYTSDVNVIRNVDRLLHSDLLESYDRITLRRALTNLGLSVPPVIVPVCMRSEPVRQAIEMRLAKSCETISASDLIGPSYVATIDLAGVSGLRLSYGDFSGLFEASEINLSGSALSSLPDQPFMALSKLIRIDLSRTRLQELPDGAFEQLPSIQLVNLSGNAITEIKPLSFEGSFRNSSIDSRVDLSGNSIQKVRSGAFSFIASLARLDLSRNQITEIQPGAFANSLIFRVDLSSNQLTRFAPGAFSGLANGAEVDLRGNPVPTAEKARLLREDGAGERVRFIFD